VYVASRLCHGCFSVQEGYQLDSCYSQARLPPGFNWAGWPGWQALDRGCAAAYSQSFSLPRFRLGSGVLGVGRLDKGARKVAESQELTWHGLWIGLWICVDCFFAAARKEVAASVKSDGVAANELAQWNADYGDGGACASSRAHLSYYL